MLRGFDLERHSVASYQAIEPALMELTVPDQGRTLVVCCKPGRCCCEKRSGCRIGSGNALAFFSAHLSGLRDKVLQIATGRRMSTSGRVSYQGRTTMSLRTARTFFTPRAIASAWAFSAPDLAKPDN